MTTSARRLSRHWHANNLRAANIPAELHAAVSALCTKAYELGKEAEHIAQLPKVSPIDAGLIQHYLIQVRYSENNIKLYAGGPRHSLTNTIRTITDALRAHSEWENALRSIHANWASDAVVSIVAVVRMDDIITGEPQ